MSRRIEKVNELIKRELAHIINREIEIPGGALLTITRVETSRDLAEAKVWISIFPIDKAKEVLGSFLRRVGYLQNFLNKRLIMQHVPRIKFLLDTTEEKAARIANILDEIEKAEQTY